MGGAVAPKDDNSLDLEHLQRTYETFHILACEKVAAAFLCAHRSVEYSVASCKSRSIAASPLVHPFLPQVAKLGLRRARFLIFTDRDILFVAPHTKRVGRAFLKFRVAYENCRIIDDGEGATLRVEIVHDSEVGGMLAECCGTSVFGRYACLPLIPPRIHTGKTCREYYPE